MVKRLAVLGLILGLVPVSAHAQSLRPLAHSSAGFLQQPSISQSDWQRQYDAAKVRKDGSKKKMLIGLGLVGGGAVMIATGGSNCTIEVNFVPNCGMSAMSKLGLATNAAGGGVFIWGLVQFFDANSELNRLAATKPAGKNVSVSIGMGQHQTLSLGLGQRSTVGYRVSW
jgi:hypothetical protein